MFRPISISFSPNFQSDDIALAVRLLFRTCNTKKPLDTFRKEFRKYIGSSYVALFSSGRAGMYYCLKALGVGKGDEVLVQAFTCVSVPDAILWTGAVPVFVDVKRETYNVDPEDFEKKITPHSKAVIVQHTFGIPANIKVVQSIARRHGLVVIEDCAHALGGSLHSLPLGSFGDLAVFSFGRDKMISSVFGGAVCVKDKKTAKVLKEFEDHLLTPTLFFVYQQLFYLIIYAISLPFYNIGLGKIILRATSMFGLLSKAIRPEERRGKMPPFIHYAFPQKLGCLLFHQWKKIEIFTRHRKAISEIYIKKLSLPLKSYPYIRVPFVVKNKIAFLDRAKRFGIHLGNWYRSPIDPSGKDATVFHYKKCKEAEFLAEHTVNLPTHINIKKMDAEKIIAFINNALEI